jgi:RNA polymerase sigma factor (sigma-70 family)
MVPSGWVGGLPLPPAAPTVSRDGGVVVRVRTRDGRFAHSRGRLCRRSLRSNVLSRDPLADPQALIRRVYGYVAYRIGDGPDAEDITSETFERALRYRSSFDPKRGDAAAWLIGIARRCIADAALNREVPTAEVPERVDDGHEQSTLQRLELREAIAGLDERDRELVALRYGADLSARQIADLLELRTNAVEVALHRALGRLRREVERDDDPAAEQPVLHPKVSR